MKASWGTREADIASPEELRSVVDEIRQSGQPTMLFMESDNGCAFVAGFGHRESVLTFVESDGASFHSRGGLDRKDFLRFLCRDQIEEFMGEMAVSEYDALAAAMQFLESGVRPTSVSWEPDW